MHAIDLIFGMNEYLDWLADLNEIIEIVMHLKLFITNRASIYAISRNLEVFMIRSSFFTFFGIYLYYIFFYGRHNILLKLGF